MKPRPQKPRIIIAHVEGSGTSEVRDHVPSASVPPSLKPVLTPPSLKIRSGRLGWFAEYVSQGENVVNIRHEHSIQQ
jgi:hypothetical protein